MKEVVIKVQTETKYTNVVPISVAVENVDDKLVKYVTVIESEGVKKQVVNFYNVETQEVKTISVKDVQVVPRTYVKEVVAPNGDIVYSSNDIPELVKKFTDLKFVLEETQSVASGMDLSNANVAVIPKDSVNSYIIESVKGDKKVTVELNYEILTNKTYVTNYHVEPLPVFVPTKPVYSPQVLTPEDKIKYIQIVKDSQIPEVKEPINVLTSTTSTHALYTETILKVETKTNVVYVKTILENGQTIPKIVDVTPAPVE